MRAVLAPMVADLSLLRGHPRPDGAPAAGPAEGGRAASAVRPTKAASTQHAEGAARLDARRQASASPSRRPSRTIASDEFLLACREPRARVRRRPAHACCGIEGAGHRRPSALRQVARRPHGRLGLVRARFTVAHGVWLDDDDMKRLGDHGASVAHNPGCNMRLGNGIADMRGMLDAQGQCRHRHRRRKLLRQSQHVRERCGLPPSSSKVQGPDWQRWITTEEVFDAATDGSARALGLGDRSAGSQRATRPTSSSSTCTTSTGSRSTTRRTSLFTPRTARPSIR